MKLRHLLTPALAATLFLGCEKPATDESKETTGTPPAQEPATPASEAAPAEETVSVTLEEEAPAAKIELPDPVATVNGKPISKEEFEKTLNDIFTSMGMQPSMLPADQQSVLHRQFVEDMVIDKLIDQASNEIEVTPQMVDEEIATISQQYGSQERFLEELQASGQSIDDFKERLTKLIRQRKWMETKTGGDVTISDADVETFYKENQQEFEQPDLVRASHILIRVEEGSDEATVEAKKKEAAALAERASKGEDFAALATEFSQDPTAKQNQGDLNFFTKDRMVPEFAEVAFAQDVDSISEPVRTQFGWHVIKVTDKKAAGTVPLEEVKTDIAQFLTEDKQRQAVDAVIQSLRDSADVQIFIADPAPTEVPAQDGAAAPSAPEGN